MTKCRRDFATESWRLSLRLRSDFDVILLLDLVANSLILRDDLE